MDNNEVLSFSTSDYSDQPENSFEQESVNNEVENLPTDDSVSNGTTDGVDNVGNEGSDTTDTLPNDAAQTEPTNQVDDNAVRNTQSTTDLFKVKANGTEYELTLDELTNLASKGIDYSKKTTAIKPYRKMVDAIASNGVSEEDLNLLIDLKKGKKEALSRLIATNNIESYDLPEDTSDYTPTDYGKTEEVQAIQDIVARLSGDTENFNVTKSFIENFDKKSMSFVYSNPAVIEGIYTDVTSGVYPEALKEAEKLAALDGGVRPILDYYIEASTKIYQKKGQQLNTEVRHTEILKEDKTKRAKQASLPKSSPTSKRTYTIGELMDEVDDEHLAWRKSVGIF